MKYKMKSGVLFSEDGQRPLMKIKGTIGSNIKSILNSQDVTVYKTMITPVNADEKDAGEIGNRQYIAVGENSEICFSAVPEYSESDDPAVNGWPVCRMPRVDTARLELNGKSYIIVMQNSQYYYISDENGTKAAEIMHRGIGGGWNIESKGEFKAEQLCVLFVFCRYIEQENEFIVL